MENDKLHHLLDEITAEINRRLPGANAYNEHAGGGIYAVFARIKDEDMDKGCVYAIGTANENWGASVFSEAKDGFAMGDSTIGYVDTSIPSESTDVLAIVDAILGNKITRENPCLRAAENRADRQTQIGMWCVAAFGEAEALSVPQRGLRLLEEAAEAAQSTGVDSELAHRLIDHVWSRPIGLLSQELGGVAVTSLALAQAAGLNADDEEKREVERVLNIPTDHFSRRNKAKNDSGLMAVNCHRRT